MKGRAGGRCFWGCYSTEDSKEGPESSLGEQWVGIWEREGKATPAGGWCSCEAGRTRRSGEGFDCSPPGGPGQSSGSGWWWGTQDHPEAGWGQSYFMRILRAMARSSSSRSWRSCSCWIIFSCAAFLSALNCLLSAFCILSLSFSCGFSLGLAAPVSLPAAGSVFFSFSPTAGDAAGLLSFSLGGDGE